MLCVFGGINMPYIKGENRGQFTLMPESLDDYISEENPVRVIDAFVNKIDIKRMGFIRHTPSKEGRPGYDPRDMLKLYIYGYFNKIRSSRRLQTECSRNIEVMWLLSKLVPDFRCIADFRKDNSAAIKKVFCEFVKLCNGFELIDRNLMVVDGSKFKAVNSRNNNYNVDSLNEKIKKIENKIEEYIGELNRNDILENSPSENSKEELKKIISELSEKKAIYEKYLYELEQTGERQISTVDVDSKLMKTRHGYDVCLNVQTVAESKNHLVVEFEATSNCSDVGLLEKTVNKAKETLEIENIEVIADKGYRSNVDIFNCLSNGDTPQVYTHDNQECYRFDLEYDNQQLAESFETGILSKVYGKENVEVSITPNYIKQVEYVEVKVSDKYDTCDKKTLIEEKPLSDYFERDLESDTVICPMGQILKKKSTHRTQGVRYANKKACRECLNKCTTSKFKVVSFKGNHTIVKSNFYRHTRLKKILVEKQIGYKVELKFYPDKYKLKKRCSIIEHPFGTIKRWCDGSYLLLKGKIKATADLALLFLGYDLKRVINILGVNEIMARI